jgi:hypothetical protein
MHHLYDSIEPSPKGELLDEKAREKLMDRYELHFDEEYSGYMDRHRIDKVVLSRVRDAGAQKASA